jgi:hypothetical protein
MAEDINKLIDQMVARGTRATEAQGAVLPGGLSAGLQGLTLGTADEITAFLRSRLGGTPYEQALAQERANLAQYREQNPIRAGAYEVGGAILPTIGAAIAAPFTGGASAAGTAAGAANIARAATTAGRAMQAAKAGATTGAVTGGAQGFGEGEGGFAPRLSGAVGGAALGGIAGGAVGAAVPAVTRGVSNILPNAERPLIQSADLGRAGQDITAAIEARAAGMPIQPATMAERLGETGMGTAEALANMPGTTRDLAASVLRSRGEQQITRTDAALRAVFGDVEDAYKQNLAIRERMKTNASPLYERAFAESKPLFASEVSILTRVPNEALSDARQFARMEGRNINITTDEVGNIILPRDAITARDLHYVKTGLDSFIEKNTDITGRQQPLATKAIKVRDELRDTLDDITKVDGRSLYQEARTMWAGEAALLDAQKVGLSIFKPGTDPRQLRASIEKMGPGEKQEFIVGVMDAIRQRMATLPEGRDANRAIFGSEKQKDVLRAAMEAAYPNARDAEARFNALSRFLARESEMKGFQGQMLGGSPTARRQAFQELVTGTGVGAAGGTGFGALTGEGEATGAAVGALAGAGRAGMRALAGRSQDIVGERLLTTDIYTQMEMLRRLAQQRAAQQAAASRQVGAYPGVVGGLIGQQIGGAAPAPVQGMLQ